MSLVCKGLRATCVSTLTRTAAGSLIAQQNSTKAANPASAPLAKRLKDTLDALLQKVGETLSPEEVLTLVRALCFELIGLLSMGSLR